MAGGNIISWKKRIAVMVIVLIAAFLILFFVEMRCNFLNWSGAPADCRILPITKILSLGFETPLFIYQYLFASPITAHPDIPSAFSYLSLLCEVVYAYFISMIYLRRKEIADKYSKWSILLFLFLFLYISWIVLFNLPFALDSSYGFGTTHMPNSSGGWSSDYNSRTAFAYSLVWPIAPFLNPEALYFSSSIEVFVGNVLPLLLVTLLIYFLFFRVKPAAQSK